MTVDNRTTINYSRFNGTAVARAQKNGYPYYCYFYCFHAHIQEVHNTGGIRGRDTHFCMRVDARRVVLFSGKGSTVNNR